MSGFELLRIALRYTLAFGRGHLSVFMASVSMIGLVLATALLLTVLSVMNGFEREMRERILALVPHITIHTPPEGGRAAGIEARFAALPGLRGWSPYASFDGMLLHGAEAAPISGIGLADLPAPLAERLPFAAFPHGGAEATAGIRGLVLGDSVAARLGAEKGATVTVLVPENGRYRDSSIRTRRLAVEAVVDTGTELDEALALVPLDIGAVLAGRPGGISGWRLTLDDPFAVDALLPVLRGSLPPGSYATTWRMTHGNLYAAIQLSRDLVVLLLASIIGVAAFNVVSALVLIVIDQRGSIAILRTLGATPATMAGLFVLQGGIIGVIGSVLGCALGALLCRLLPSLVASIEAAMGQSFLATDVYPVSFIPVDLRAGDALLIAVIAIVMCILAALYPALRAARLAPAAVLQARAD